MPPRQTAVESAHGQVEVQTPGVHVGLAGMQQPALEGSTTQPVGQRPFVAATSLAGQARREAA